MFFQLSIVCNWLLLVLFFLQFDFYLCTYNFLSTKKKGRELTSLPRKYFFTTGSLFRHDLNDSIWFNPHTGYSTTFINGLVLLSCCFLKKQLIHKLFSCLMHNPVKSISAHLLYTIEHIFCQVINFSCCRYSLYYMHLLNFNQCFQTSNIC